MRFKDSDIYQRARRLSKEAWDVYQTLPWETKKSMGDQFIQAVDSVGANIAEGWGRFHFLDRNRFNYNARGSLTESIHWIDLLTERGFISVETSASLNAHATAIHLMLNNLINALKKKSEEIS